MYLLADYNLRIFYEDTDAGGIVYHSNYLKYCERARSQFLIGVWDFENKNAITSSKDSHLYVVKSINCEFSQAAQLFDQIRVESKIVQLQASSLLFEQACYKAERILFSAEVKIVCINSQSFKPVRIPRSHSDFLQSNSSSQEN